MQILTMSTKDVYVCPSTWYSDLYTLHVRYEVTVSNVNQPMLLCNGKRKESLNNDYANHPRDSRGMSRLSRRCRDGVETQCAVWAETALHVLRENGYDQVTNTFLLNIPL